jgi:hypothetical protein
VSIEEEVWWALEQGWTMWRREKLCPYWGSNSDLPIVASHSTDFPILGSFDIVA